MLSQITRILQDKISQMVNKKKKRERDLRPEAVRQTEFKAAAQQKEHT